MGALSLLAYYLPLWFQVVKGASTKSGVMTLPSAISQALGSLVAAKVGPSSQEIFLMDDMLILDSSNPQRLHPMGNIWKCTERDWCRAYVCVSSLDWRR